MREKKLLPVIILGFCLVSNVFISCIKTPDPEITIGVLSYAKLTEEQYTIRTSGINRVMALLENQGYVKANQRLSKPKGIKYYDTLESLVLALKSGEINAIGDIPQSTARYLCSRDHSLEMSFEFDDFKQRERRTFANTAYNRLAQGYAFLLREEECTLRDKIDLVIIELKADGTLDKLINQYIYTPDIPTAKLPEKKAGLDTIRFAITGCLPPLDYINSEGFADGFSIALIGEIGKRLDKNVEVVPISPIERAIVLNDNYAEVVLWARTLPDGSDLLAIPSKFFEEQKEKGDALLTKEERKALKILDTALPDEADGDFRTFDYTRDLPPRTILTNPYFVDMPVAVLPKTQS